MKGYPGFIKDRVTAFPALYELIMAARKMAERLEQSEFSYLICFRILTTTDSMRHLKHKPGINLITFTGQQLQCILKNHQELQVASLSGITAIGFELMMWNTIFQDMLLTITI
ncbi:TPA: hypothetical protein JAN03_24275 [Citrobacter freundii]|nr:hypothetical protein [Citrobacter freundii]